MTVIAISPESLTGKHNWNPDSPDQPETAFHQMKWELKGVMDAATDRIILDIRLSPPNAIVPLEAVIFAAIKWKALPGRAISICCSSSIRELFELTKLNRLIPIDTDLDRLLNQINSRTDDETFT